MCSAKRSTKRKLLFDFLNRQKLNVAAFASGLKLNARVFRVSPVANDRRLIALRRLLHGENRLAVILFGEGLALEHKVFGGGQLDYVKALRNIPGVVLGNLHALNVFGGAGRSKPLWQPKADRLAAEGIHAQQRAPNIAAHLFAIGKIFGGFYAALDDNLVRRLADYLNKYIFNVAFII